MTDARIRLVRTLASVRRGDFSSSLLHRLRKGRRSVDGFEQAGPPLSGVRAKVGSIPNLHGDLADLSAFITRLLDGLGVPYYSTQASRHPKKTIIIESSNFSRAVSAIRESLPFQHWHAEQISDTEILLSINHVDLNGRLINNKSSSLRLEGWNRPQSSRRPDGGLWPDNSLVPTSSRSYDIPFAILPADGSVFEPTESVLSFTRPVDVVYTWVDASDEVWNENRLKALNSIGGEINPLAYDPVRYESFDELKYSLRSVFTYAGWVRKIFIVTDEQVPDWLDVSHPRIEIIDHKQILPHSVYNSHAIESRLHHIPGLSEHYLYLNDDVFFGAPVYPEDFFASEAISRFFPAGLPLDSTPPSPMDPPIMAAAKNNRSLILEKFGKSITQKIRHTVHPQQRSVNSALEACFPRAFESVSTSLFRHYLDISVASSLSHWYAYMIGRSVPSEISSLYVNLAHSTVGKTLDALYSLRRFSTFCLNQEYSSEANRHGRDEAACFLRDYFPYQAPWELVLDRSD